MNLKSQEVASAIPVDLWSYESKVYPSIDSAGMREEKSAEAKWQLGDGYNVALKVETLDKETVSNSRIIKLSSFDLSR